MLGRSSINALAAKGRNIFQNIGVIPGLNEKIIERCSLATREYNQLMQVSRGRADWLDPDHFRRGRVYENRVCAEDFTDMIQTPSTAQSFDAIRFSDGHAVSIKSLNTNLPSYARPSQITSTLNKYVRNIVDFERMLIPEIGEVRPNMINSCELFVGVPPEITLPQFMAAQKSIRLARQHGISLRLRIEE
jgi:hypothetical protein